MTLTPTEEQELRELLSKRLAFDRDPVLGYVPHPKARKAHIAPAKTRLVLGANQTGKTTFLVAEAMMHATGVYPDWYPKELQLDVPNVGLLCGASFEEGIGQVLMPKLEEYLPRGSARPSEKRNSQGVPIHLYFPFYRGVRVGAERGSRIDLMSYEQEARKFEGSTRDWAAFDEPVPQPVYVAVKRGLMRRGGRDWAAMTLLSEPWILSELIERAEDDPEVFICTMGIWDNCVDYGGYLSREEIEHFAKVVPPEERDARLKGRPIFLQGLVYPDFDPDLHTIAEMPRIPEHAQVVCGIDPHDSAPTHVLWAAVWPNNQVVFFDQLTATGSDVRTIAYQILEREAAWRVQPVWRVIDEKASRSPTVLAGRTTFAEQFAAFGIQTTPSDSTPGSLPAGHQIVRAFLQPRFDQVQAKEVPGVLFCRNTCGGHHGPISAMRRYSRNLDLIKAGRGHLERPKEDPNKHWCDVVRYVLTYLYRFPLWRQQQLRPRPKPFGAEVLPTFQRRAFRGCARGGLM